MYDGPFRGAAKIAERWKEAVENIGSEWIVFDRASGLIKEIRAYYASPQDAEMERLELGGFDYKGREHSLASPWG